MVNNSTKTNNIGSTAVNRLNLIDPVGAYDNYGRLVKLLVCCEYVKHGKLRSRLTKQQLRYNFTRDQRLYKLPKWLKSLKAAKIVKNWDVKDPKELF